MTRYELIERIGAGGMAEIFRGKAIAAGGFEKPVAIKRILPHLSQDRRFVELLIAEANILSHLRHRNIVQIFDVGLGDDGQYFLVMEFVDGADLGALQRRLEALRKRLPVELALHVGAEVCEALEHAHTARGPDQKLLRIVHRDVSPSNVLLSRSGEVKLTDFGIAKRPEEVTGHGGVRGKFAYISPEQSMNIHVDARSDVYSAGILIYEMAVGQRLFSHLPDFEALRAVREGFVRPPREIDPTLPVELEEILMKALARDPNERFAGAGELGQRLRTLRYAMESSGDPSKEIARILNALLEEAVVAAVDRKVEHAAASGEREARAREERNGRRAERDDNRTEFREPTVVRIHTAAGFTASGTDALNTDTASFVKAKNLLDSFEEEETQAMSGIPLDMREGLGDNKRGKRPWVQDTQSQTRLVDAHVQRASARIAVPAAAAAAASAAGSPMPSAAASTGPATLSPAAVAANATGPRPKHDPQPSSPRVRPSSRMSATLPPPATASMTMPSSSPTAVVVTMPERAATPTIRDLFHRGGLLPGKEGAAPTLARPEPRRRWIILAGAALVVAVLSFLLARVWLSSGDGDSAPAPAVVDAGAPQPAAGSAAAIPDAGAAAAGSAAEVLDADAGAARTPKKPGGKGKGGKGKGGKGKGGKGR